MLVVQLNQLHPKATSFFSNLITEIFGPSVIRNQKNGKCDIQINGVRMSKPGIFLEKVKRSLGRGASNVPAELMYQSGEMASNREAKLNFWYTGENIRPPLHLDYDYFLSFDQDDFGGRNIYFPLWYLDFDWGFGEKFRPRIGLDIKGMELGESRKLSEEKTGFACAFIGHNHPIRYEAISRFSEIGKVDVFGKAVGRPVASKFSIARNYRYTICFENDIYPGYVTEKLLDAYYCETIPIYWGDLGQEDIINRDSLLNLYNYSSLDSFKQKIVSINDEEFRAIYNHSFINKLPSLDKLKDALISAK